MWFSPHKRDKKQESSAQSMRLAGAMPTQKPRGSKYKLGHSRRGKACYCSEAESWDASSGFGASEVSSRVYGKVMESIEASE